MARSLKIFKDKSKKKKKKNRKQKDPQWEDRSKHNNRKHRPIKLNSDQKIYTGTIGLRKSGNGWVRCNELDVEIFIPRIYTRGAFDGDEVEVILIETPKVHNVEGKIINVTKRNSIQFVGELIKTRDRWFSRCDNGLKVKLSDKKEKKFRTLEDGTIIVVEIDKWEEPIRGHIIEVLGDKSDPHVSLKRIARKHGFYEKFPDGVFEELGHFTQDFIEQSAHGRADIKNEMAFTVDPTDAKDFDDAITISKSEEGIFDLGVHIADVSSYIEEGGELDKEALKRSFSLYMPSSVIPMLPKKLSNLLCSLNPDIERLSLSCFMQIDSLGHILKYNFKETVIKSAMRFDYKTFQENLEAVQNGKEIEEKYERFRDIFLWSKELKDILKNKRIKDGSIEFSLPEVKIEVDKDGKTTNIYKYISYESCNIIEEFMLSANRCAADMLTKKIGKLPAVYRIHDKPSEERIIEYFNDLEKNDIKFNIPEDLTEHKFIQSVLAKVKTCENGDILTQNFLRSMMKAKYSTENIGHYGLAFKLYTHFTSPIRRYPDLLVHRLIKKHLHKLPINKKIDNQENYERMCKQASIQEMKSIKAEYEARDTKITEYMIEKIGNTYTGVIVSVTPYGAYVKLNEIPIEGMLHIRRQFDDKYEFNEDKKILKGQRTGNELFIGKDVEIEVADIDSEMLTIDFILAGKVQRKVKKIVSGEKKDKKKRRR